MNYKYTEADTCADECGWYTMWEHRSHHPCCPRCGGDVHRARIRIIEVRVPRSMWWNPWSWNLTGSWIIDEYVKTQADE